ncbi:MAG TPA: PHP domain-containing protein, partial [Ktedonobacterales bacterium]|nr:PHP domain-containing protein [Ktedonobacterales bacterium]
PGRSDGEIHRFDPPELIELLDEQPLDGLEVYYPVHRPEQVQTYAALARERGLLQSAGSDSHSLRHRAPIRYPPAYCAELLARLGIAVE